MKNRIIQYSYLIISLFTTLLIDAYRHTIDNQTPFGLNTQYTYSGICCSNDAPYLVAGQRYDNKAGMCNLLEVVVVVHGGTEPAQKAGAVGKVARWRHNDPGFRGNGTWVVTWDDNKKEVVITPQDLDEDTSPTPLSDPFSYKHIIHNKTPFGLNTQYSYESVLCSNDAPYLIPWQRYVNKAGITCGLLEVVVVVHGGTEAAQNTGAVGKVARWRSAFPGGLYNNGVFIVTWNNGTKELIVTPVAYLE